MEVLFTILLSVIALTILLGLLWVPTILVFRNNAFTIKSKTVISFLLLQLLASAGIILIAELAGLTNPGGIILASILFTSVVGCFIAAKFKISGS